MRLAKRLAPTFALLLQHSQIHNDGTGRTPSPASRSPPPTSSPTSPSAPSSNDSARRRPWRRSSPPPPPPTRRHCRLRSDGGEEGLMLYSWPPLRSACFDLRKHRCQNTRIPINTCIHARTYAQHSTCAYAKLKILPMQAAELHTGARSPSRSGPRTLFVPSDIVSPPAMLVRPKRARAHTHTHASTHARTHARTRTHTHAHTNKLTHPHGRG